MRLGSETGSLVNHIHANSAGAEPVKGMGVTFLGWSDRSPGTIQRVFQIGRFLAIGVTNDDATRTDSNGMSEDQTYTYTERPDRPQTVWRLKDGVWSQMTFNAETGRWKMYKGGRLRVGSREKYHDFSF